MKADCPYQTVLWDPENDTVVCEVLGTKFKLKGNPLRIRWDSGVISDIWSQDVRSKQRPYEEFLLHANATFQTLS